MRFIIVITGLFVLLSSSVSLFGAENSKKIRIGLPKEQPPFAFYDKNLKATRGFSVDLAVMLGKVLGAKVILLGYYESELIDALKKGRIDVIGGFFQKPDPDGNIQLIDTGIRVDRHIFAHESCLTVTCLKDLASHRVVQNMTPIPKQPGVSLSAIRSIESKSVVEALRILDMGKADVYISNNSLTTLYQIQKLGLENIKQVGMPFETVSLSLAVLKDRPELLSDLSLGLGKILESQYYVSLKKKWFGQEIKSGIWDRYIRYILMVLAGLALFLLIFAFWNILLKRRVTRVTGDLVMSEQRYRELIESSPDIIHIISDDGRVQMTNKNARNLLESHELDSTEFNFVDLFIPEQREEVQRFINDLFKKGTGESELVFMDDKGGKVPVEIAATTFQCPQHADLMASCFSRDIRERKSLEEELIRSERLAIMGQMSAGIAHEINNPLGIISGYAQDLLAEGIEGNRHRESLDTIVKNCERANHIISDLLSFSRQTPPVMEPIELMSVLEASLLLIKSEIKKRKISIQTEFPTTPVIINGDENQLIQVFINLLTNAAQAVEENGTIRIGYNIPASHHQKVTIDIEDNGSGIKAAAIEKLFDPFYSTKETGFGLGLFVSNIIIRRHEGTVLAESKEGHGTIIHVTLPLSSELNIVNQRESYGLQNTRC